MFENVEDVGFAIVETKDLVSVLYALAMNGAYILLTTNSKTRDYTDVFYVYLKEITTA